jgi:predicted metalloprotease with PDZ domain
LGANVSTVGGKLTVTSVLRDGSAWQGGLNVNDEILALDGNRLADDPNKALTGRAAGSEVKLLVARDGQMKELTFPILASTARRYRVEKLPTPSADQQKVLTKWLRTAQ